MIFKRFFYDNCFQQAAQLAINRVPSAFKKRYKTHVLSCEFTSLSVFFNNHQSSNFHFSEFAVADYDKKENLPLLLASN